MTITHKQEFYGYLEQAKQNRISDKATAALALCTCVCDGHLDSEEVLVLKAFFKERFAGLEREEAEKRKTGVNRVIRKVREVFNAKGRRRGAGRELWKESCRNLLDIGNQGVILDAYELCVRLVACDGTAHRRELTMLDETAKMLDIPSDTDQQLRDRYFTMGMFGAHQATRLLNIPDHLSKEEQKRFLSEEYAKWRGRATHSDPEIAAEANVRLQRIAEARRKLEDEP